MKWNFNEFLANLSIRAKLSYGFGVILLVLTGVVATTLWSLNDTRVRVSAMNSETQPTVFAAIALKEKLRECAAAIGFYFLTAQDQHKKAFEDSLSVLSTLTKELKNTPLAKKNTEIRATVNLIEIHIRQLQSFQSTIIKYATDSDENMPAARFAGENLQPLTQAILASTSAMISSEMEESVSTIRRQILFNISEVRYVWSNIMNFNRAFLIGGQMTNVDNIHLYLPKLKRDLEALEKMKDILTFEQQEGIQTIQAAIKKWEQQFKIIVELRTGDKAKMDAYLIKTEISPLIDKINANLNRLVTKEQYNMLTSSKSLLSQTQQTTSLVSILLGIGLIFGILIGWVITNAITGPIAVTADAMNNIAEGEGDLTFRLKQRGKDELSMLALGFNRYTEKIHHMVKAVSTRTGELGRASRDMEQSAQTTKRVVAQQKKAVDEIVHAVRDLDKAVEETAGHAQQVAAETQLADTKTAEGHKTVNNALNGINSLVGATSSVSDAIQKLAQDIESVGGIVDVIRGITEQTNLLALNAAIEAARAGEQGRGFAVVADEVRVLSTRTQQSTHEISNKIAQLQKNTRYALDEILKSKQLANETIGLTSEASHSLRAITQAVSNITQMITRIATAAEEQSAVVREISQNSTQLSTLADQAAVDSTQSLKVSESMLSISDDLKQLVMRFRT